MHKNLNIWLCFSISFNNINGIIFNILNIHLLMFQSISNNSPFDGGKSCYNRKLSIKQLSWLYTLFIGEKWWYTVTGPVAKMHLISESIFLTPTGTKHCGYFVQGNSRAPSVKDHPISQHSLVKGVKIIQ